MDDHFADIYEDCDDNDDIDDDDDEIMMRG